MCSAAYWNCIILRIRTVSYTHLDVYKRQLLSNLLLTEQNGVSAVNLVVTLVFVCAGILILNYKKAVSYTHLVCCSHTIISRTKNRSERKRMAVQKQN